MSIKIIADSTCDLSPELIKKYDIGIIPLHIIMDGQSFDDGVNVTPDDIFKWSEETKNTPGTSSSSMMEIIDVYKEYLKTYDYLLCFSISRKFSGSYNMMRSAARELDALDRIYVINSKNLCSAIGLLIIKAKEMVDKGKEIEEIYAKIRDMRPYVNSSFVVDTLDYLHRGGRCSDAAHLLGVALKMHPKIIVEEGEMRVSKKYRGNMKRVHREYLEDLKDELKKARKERVFLSYSGDYPDDLDEIRDILYKKYRFKEVLVTRAGGVISSHCGPGTMAIFFMEK